MHASNGISPKVWVPHLGHVSVEAVRTSNRLPSKNNAQEPGLDEGLPDNCQDQ